MAEHRAGTSFQSESDNYFTKQELYSSAPVEDIDSDSSDEHELVITNEIVEYVRSKDRRIYWMLTPFTSDEDESLPPSKTFVSTPTICSISNITDIKSVFRMYLNHSIIDTIVMSTNKEGRKVYGNDWTELTEESLEAFMGLLLLGGVFQSPGESMKRLWNAETGRQIFRAAMSLKIFLQISRALRFNSDDPSQENKKDELAPIRPLWDKWLQLLPKFYNPGNNITVGEQIIGFKGLCAFKQYSSAKSSHGIKIFTLCDSKTSYVLKSQISTGKLSEISKKCENMQAVLSLTQGLKYRNVTCNNTFASHQLGQLLLRRKLSLLGSVISCRPELPAVEANKAVYSSEFYFTKDTTLVHYVPKKNQSVYLMSTKHKQGNVNDKEEKKPLIYMEYESTKGAVERLDREIALYSCKRKANHWATTLFYHIIDTSAYNAFILWMGIYPNWKGNKVYKRRLFLEELGKTLILPYMTTRKNYPDTEEARALLKSLQEKCGYIPPTSSCSKRRTPKKPKCKFCPMKCDNKKSPKCISCKKFLCKEHTIYICSDCKK